MNFIAEIVLGYADSEITKKIEDHSISEYKIIRYRDDYRIFAQSPTICESILRIISEVLAELGLKINQEKTKVNHNIVTTSIKSDKIEWIRQKQYSHDIQQQAILLHEFSLRHPGSGSLKKALSKFYKRIKSIKSLSKTPVIISIILDIALRSPSTYSHTTAILSILLSHIDNSEERSVIMNQIIRKFTLLPNTGLVQIHSPC